MADPDRALLSTFNFRVALNHSSGGVGMSAGAHASIGVSASASVSAGAGIGASVSAGVSAGLAFGGGTGSGSAQLGDGGFQECSGLQIEMDVHEIQEGGRNDGVVKLAGGLYREHAVLAVQRAGGQVDVGAGHRLLHLVHADAARGELADDALARFPQLIIAPGLVAIMWSALFEKYEPLDVPAMIRAHIGILFGGRAT